jgi:hypothetical protein
MQTEVNFPVEVLRAHFPAQEQDFDHLDGADQIDDFALHGNGCLAVIEWGDDLYDFTIQSLPEIFAVNEFQDFITYNEQLIEGHFSAPAFVFSSLVDKAEEFADFCQESMQLPFIRDPYGNLLTLQECLAQFVHAGEILLAGYHGYLVAGFLQHDEISSRTIFFTDNRPEI